MTSRTTLAVLEDRHSCLSQPAALEDRHSCLSKPPALEDRHSCLSKPHPERWGLTTKPSPIGFRCLSPKLPFAFRHYPRRADTMTSRTTLAVLEDRHSCLSKPAALEDRHSCLSEPAALEDRHSCLSTCLSRVYRLCLGLLALTLAAAGSADRRLDFAARERAEGPLRIGEVTGGGQVLIRLRSKAGSVLPRAQKAAEGLQKAAVAGLSPPALTVVVGPDGSSILKGDGQEIVTADKETAQLSSTTPTALAASWQSALNTVFREPYLVLSEPDGLQVPVDEARYVAYGGPLGKHLSATSGDEAVALAKLEPTNRRLKVYGAGPGDTAVALKAGALSLGLPVQVRFWAAKILPTAVAELTGSGQDGHTATRVAVNAALAAAQPQPGATVSAISTDREGPLFRVGVLATGQDCIDAKRQVEVTLKWVTPPTLEPVDVFVSNSPERIVALGSLMREQLLPDRAARFLYHHVNSTEQTVLFVARIANAGPGPAAAHVILGESGPDKDELGVGHAAAARFWREQRTGSGYVLQVPPMTASDIVRTPVGREAIVSGLAQITPLSSSPLLLEVAAVPVGHETEWVEPLRPEDYASPKLTTFRFGARKAVELKHEIGGAWTFFSLGKEGSTNEAGTYLAGDYGVLHEIDLELTNAREQTGFAEMEVRASGGVMRGLFLIDNVLHETGLLVGTQQERVLKLEVPSGATRRVRIETIPESASNYPVHLIVHSRLRNVP